MRVLRNELSWSRSRIVTLSTCARRYWYQYYRKWDGWNADAPEERRIAYRLSQMTNLTMLAGLAAHDAIRQTLLAVRDRRALEEPAEELAAGYMRAVWEDARARRWERMPKQAPPVFELYYQDGVSRDEIRRHGEIARRAVRTFEGSELFRRIAATDTSRWLAVDDGADFNTRDYVSVEGARVWALPDFAHEDGGRCVIYDWKTGSQKAEDRMQLVAYALHAHDVWHYPADRIDTVAVYLGETLREVRHAIDAAALDEIRGVIAGDLAVMRRLEPSAEDAGAFALTTNDRACEECAFRELCEKVRATPMHRRTAATGKAES